VIQRREDGSVNFFREWDSYREGFGKITGEYWLGLKQIHALSIQGNYELRIDLEDFENSTAFAQYGVFGVGLFSVDPEDDGYPLTIADYSGTAGDSLLKHNGMKFTTKDRDNDHSENNCASFYHGAWWYRNCHTSNLNGQYLRGQHTSYADGIEWSSWTGWQYSLKFTEMKIRPTREERESKGTLVQKKKVRKLGGKGERERRSRRRAVQRFLWEFVSHLSDRPLVSILATLSDRHCQVIISQPLHLAHTQMEAVYLTFQRSDIWNVNIVLLSPCVRAAPFISRPFFFSLLVFFSFVLPPLSLHSFGLFSVVPCGCGKGQHVI
ncbi:hypothetical protein QQF64_027865, partial [Cirrhinus molitorella]